jgi:hypothetical protein
MAFLLADVGGTNARMALARDGAIDTATITRFRGDDHASFDEVVRIYLEQQGNPAIAGGLRRCGRPGLGRGGAADQSRLGFHRSAALRPDRRAPRAADQRPDRAGLCDAGAGRRGGGLSAPRPAGRPPPMASGWW